MSDLPVLVCKLNTGCYNSTDFFADQAAEALEKLGQEVRIFEWNKDGADGLEKLFDVPFLAVLDFNSKLPRMRADDRPVLDYLNGPKYDWLLDHPLYHHNALESITPKQDFHVLCLDRLHAEYVNRLYPAVRSAVMLPLGGVAGRRIPWKQKKAAETLIFCGTYCEPELIMDCILQSPDEIRDTSLKMIELMKQNPDITVENAYHRASGKTPGPIGMQMNFLADTYIRAYFREKILDVLLDADLPVHLYGPNWLDYAAKRKIEKKLLHGEISYEKSLEIQSEHGIVLNIMPWFKAGAHDRIFTAMSAESICLTDTSEYLAQQFTEGREYAGYDLKRLSELADQVRELLSQPARMQEIAQTGYASVTACHMWKHRMEEFLQML